MAMIEKIIFCLAIVLMVLILFGMYFSENGIRDHEQLTWKQSDILSRIQIVKQENKTIENQILRLQQDAAYIKHLARHEHGMAAPDELIFKQTKE